MLPIDNEMQGIPGSALNPFMTQQVEVSLGGVVDALNIVTMQNEMQC